MNGTVQLLIPAWRFDCRGTISLWEAYVQNNITSPAGADIQFQAFRPSVDNNGNFNLVYGNRFVHSTDSLNSSKITMNVNPSAESLRVPIRPGYIVGVRLNSSSVRLLYDPSGGVDVYYWDNLGPGLICNFSLCDTNVKVLRNITPLFGWTFGRVHNYNNIITVWLKWSIFYKYLSLCNFSIKLDCGARAHFAASS